ncbi:uncharacterized protein LOC121729499 [Aricia agestis]|uniref:uncharacterized protein LOC121729499 n=1 Tax=Aricia agestis TaxID=91739 RepID=UPI001C201AD4|nr:uncharacterized protein LOC121729499 [Aricia agestis]
MKSFALAFLVLVAGAVALPQYGEVHVVDSVDAAESREARLVSGAIVAAIQEVSQRIRDAGLDPVLVDRVEANVVVVPLVAEISAFVDRLEFVGLSNIAVNHMDYSVLLNRMRFDVSLPEIRLAVGNSALHLVLLGNSAADANFRGTGSVRQIRLAGEVRVNIGIISGISIRSLELYFSVGHLESDVHLSILGLDLSRLVNTIVNDTIPAFLSKYQNDINNLLEKIVWEVIDRVM